jgi:pimeloyl-ACP methyl ester carboxylesterase
MKVRSRFNDMSTAAGTWSELIVGGHPCYAYEPPERSPHGDTVMYLHGVHLGRLDERPTFGHLFDRYGLRCIAPVTQRSWWTDRICAEFDPNISAERHVLDRVLPWLAEHWTVAPPRIALFGTSMGGQGALRLAYKHPNVFPIAVAISPAIDYQMRMEDGDPTLDQMYRDSEQARQDTATLHIHPLNWPRHQWFCCDPVDYRWHESAERLRSKLYSLGVPHTCDLETSGGGHSWEYYERMAEPAFRFVVEALVRERLRV